jgi:integrase
MPSTFTSTKKAKCMENINVFPGVHSHRPNRLGEVPVFVCVTFNNKVVARDPVHRKIPLKDWDPVKRVARNNDLLNALIAQRKSDIENDLTRRQLLGEKITTALIKRVVGGDTSAREFYPFADGIIQNKRLADGNGYSEDTKRRYRDEILHMKQYAPVLFFSDINIEWLTGYREWLLNDYKKKDGNPLHKNSVWKALGFARMIWNEAIEASIVKRDNYPFKKIVGAYETNTSKIRYLELNQVEAIERVLTESVHLLEPITVAIGWRFLAMCVSAMRISDAMNFDASYINDAGQVDFTPYKTRRHGNTARVPIVSDRQRRYLDMAIKHTLPQRDAKSFRKAFNDRLKIITALAGIEMHITSHVGRHTMGSFLIDGGVEKPAAMKMFGVKSERTIQVYQHLKEGKLISEAEKLKGVF